MHNKAKVRIVVSYIDARYIKKKFDLIVNLPITFTHKDIGREINNALGSADYTIEDLTVLLTYYDSKIQGSELKANAL